MKKNRRDFLKLTGLSGFSLIGTHLLGNAAGLTSDLHEFREPGGQRFNMSGHAAPKLDTVRVGFIGLGMRGPAHLKNMTKLEGVEIKALCDIRPEYANKMNLAAMIPLGSLASSGYCLANTSATRAELLVYQPGGPEITKGKSVRGGTKRTLTAPFSGDVVLYLAQIPVQRI